MKTLVFLLVLANLLFYAFGAGHLGQSENPDAARMTQEIRPEKMRIVSRGDTPGPAAPAANRPGNAGPAAENGSAADAREAAAAPGEAQSETRSEGRAEARPETRAEARAEAPAPAPTKKAAEASICLAWKGLDTAAADKLSAALEARAAGVQLQRQVIAGEGTTWWVYIPPLAGRAEAEKKAGQLRGLGVTDYFILQDGNTRNAISLGVFSSEKGAQERLADVKARGVRSARLAPRLGKEGSITVLASGPGKVQTTLTAAAAAALPNTAPQACP